DSGCFRHESVCDLAVSRRADTVIGSRVGEDKPLSRHFPDGEGGAPFRSVHCPPGDQFYQAISGSCNEIAWGTSAGAARQGGSCLRMAVVGQVADAAWPWDVGG